MLQGVHMRRCEVRASPSHAMQICTNSLGRCSSSRLAVVCRSRGLSRLCQCTDAMVVICPLSDISLKISCNESLQSSRFRSRVWGKIGMKQSNGRTRDVCAVNATRRNAEESRAASMNDETSEGLREEMLVSSLVDEAPQIGRGVPMNLAAGVGVTAAVIMMGILGFVAKPRNENGGGSVSDLIKRGQLRSDRGDGKALKYEDPFNNPFVGGKSEKENTIVKMYGKLFRVAPITLTDEKRVSHQNRRVQAYRWKRPVVFLSEGEPVPEGVDPEEVRWIPANHPFATTANYIDEDLAQQNVMQVRGVPSRLKAEHEALRKKMMEAANKEPEFKLPDSSVDQWGSPPSARAVSDSEIEGEQGERRRLDRRRSPSVTNGSPRLRNIDGSEILDEPQ